MANDIGIGGQFFIDGQDVSELLSAFRHTSVTGNVDTTRLRTEGRFRRHAVTLHGGSIGITGDLPDDDAAALVELNRYLERNATPHIIMQAPFGADFGKLVRLGKALRTNSEMGTEIEAVLSLNAEFEKTAGSPGVLSGQCLFTPNAGATRALNQKNSVVFTNAPSGLAFGLRAAGTTETFTFTTETTNAEFKAGVESLAAYAGRTVTVTGAVLSGTTSKSGTKVFEFSGASAVPLFEIRAAEVRRFVVTNGDFDADYSADGGALFALGISESNFQTNQRAKGGAHTGVVCVGSSVAAQPEGVVVSGAGDAASNGTYLNKGVVINTRPRYELGTTHVVEWQATTPGRWAIIDVGAGLVRYFVNSDANTPPANGWTAESAVAPAPTLAPKAASPGTADFTSYFPLGVTPSAPTATGTGATNTVSTAAGASTTAIPEISQAGRILTGINLVNAATSGAALRDLEPTGTSNKGLLASLQATLVEGGNATWIIEHAPDVAGAPGAWATLLTFDTVSQSRALYAEVAPGVVIQPHLRARCTAVTGNVVVAIGVARRF
ncbi:MAG: hypothetical protein KY445_02715 [Armatimonadetes bacterium]|nr:hypothetical protein [Armatimonadota bacterium]